MENLPPGSVEDAVARVLVEAEDREMGEALLIFPSNTACWRRRLPLFSLFGSRFWLCFKHSCHFP